MIYFKCSQCNEHLEAPASMIGDKIQCPVCKFPEIVPDNEEKIHLDLGASAGTSDKVGVMGSSQIKAFGSAETHKKDHKWRRTPVVNGNGACRMRVFHSRLSENAMEYMEDFINDWLDANPDIEIKFSNSTVGLVEGKKTESHLIVTVWY